MGISFDKEYSQSQIDAFYGKKEKSAEKNYLIITTHNAKIVVKSVAESELNVFQKIWARLGLGNLAFGRVAKLCAREGVVNDGLIKAVDRYNTKVDMAVQNRLAIAQFRKTYPQHGEFLDKVEKGQFASEALLEVIGFAFEKNAMNVVRALLDCGLRVDPDLLNKKLWLHLACHAGNLNLAKFLLSRPEANQLLRQKDANGMTPLALHIFSSDEPHCTFNEALVKLLLEHGADVNDVGRNGLNVLSTYLVDAAKQKVLNLKVVSMLLRAGADVNQKDVDGCTALHHAVILQNPKAVELLLRKPGIDLSLKDNEKRSALQHALKSGNAEIIKLLMKRDKGRLREFTRVVEDFQKKLSAEEKHDLEPILESFTNSFTISSEDAGWKLLQRAVEYRDYTMVGLMVAFEKPATTDYVSRRGAPIAQVTNYFLLRAASEGEINILKMLLDCGANLTQQDDLYQTASKRVQYAPESKKGELERILVEASEFNGPLQRAVVRGDREAIERMLSQIKFETPDFDRLIGLAIVKKDYSLAWRFCEFAGKRREESPFSYYFAQITRPKELSEGFVKFLLQQNPEPRELSSAFVKLFSQAQEMWELNHGLIKLFIEKGADVNSKDRDSATCLHYACASGDDKLVTWLLEQSSIDIPADIEAKNETIRNKVAWKIRKSR